MLRTLFRAHQTHYEQMGRLEGTIIIKDVKDDGKNDGKNDFVNDTIKDETRKLVMDSFRDHSYGKYSYRHLI